MFQARYGQSDRVLGVVLIKARCAGRGSLLSVMVTERPSCRRDSVQVWSAHATRNPKESDRTPNTPLQPTASRARSCLF